MTYADIMKLEDAASAAMALRGARERAYRSAKTQRNWRELTIAAAAASRAMLRLRDARRLLAASERAEREAARTRRTTMQPSLI